MSHKVTEKTPRTNPFLRDFWSKMAEKVLSNALECGPENMCFLEGGGQAVAGHTALIALRTQGESHSRY